MKWNLFLDDELNENTILRIIQTLDNYLKVPVANDTYILTKYDEIQITDVTAIKQGNGQILLNRWKYICKNKNISGVTRNFIRAAKQYSPTSNSGATTLPAIWNAFTYIETSANNHGHDEVFVSWERTDMIQISNITLFISDFHHLMLI